MSADDIQMAAIVMAIFRRGLPLCLLIGWTMATYLSQLNAVNVNIETPRLRVCKYAFSLQTNSSNGYSVLPNTIAKNGAENINKSKSPIDKLTIKALGTVLNDFSLNIIYTRVALPVTPININHTNTIGTIMDINSWSTMLSIPA
jgi:hypothetical protein